MEQVMKIEKLISLFQYQILNFSTLILLYKIFKVARLTIAHKIDLNNTHTDLLRSNIYKK